LNSAKTRKQAISKLSQDTQSKANGSSAASPQTSKPSKKQTKNLKQYLCDWRTQMISNDQSTESIDIGCD